MQISAQKVPSADPATGDHGNIVFTRPVQGAAPSQEGVKEEVSSLSATQAGCVECAIGVMIGGGGGVVWATQDAHGAWASLLTVTLGL